MKNVNHGFKSVPIKVRNYSRLFLFLGSLYFGMASPVMAQNAMSKLTIQLVCNTNNTSITTDGCMALFKTGFSDALGNEDSYKFTNPDENIAIMHGATLLSVEGKAPIENADTILLKIWQYRRKQYCLQFNGSAFSPQLFAVLHDNFLNKDTTISLNAVTNVPFVVTSDAASSASNRFVVYIKQLSSMPVDILTCSAMQQENGTMIRWSTMNDANVDHYDIERGSSIQTLKKLIAVAPISTNGNKLVNHQLLDIALTNNAQYYRINAVGLGGQIARSRLIKIMGNTKMSSINVYPNPVVGNRIGLQLFNLAAGTYQVSLYYGSNGTSIYNTTIQHSGGNATRFMTVYQSLLKGSYTLSVSNGLNVYTRSILIN